MEEAGKQCLDCGKKLIGRIDKKFCDDYCRNSYNNRKHADRNNLIRNITNILRKNRRTLAGLIPPGEDTAKIKKDRLLEKGYNFTYQTHIFRNQRAQVYTFCYDFGYLELEAGWLLIVRRKENSVSL